MISRLVRAILILPGTVLVVVPALILWLAHGTALEARPAGIDDPRFWIGVLLFSSGLVFAIWRAACSSPSEKARPHRGTHRTSWSCMVPTGTSATR
jgi:hypothetical protein